MKSMSRSILKV